MIILHITPSLLTAPALQVEPVMKTEYDEVWDWRVENENKPIWTRNPKEVSDTAYNDFFKVMTTQDGRRVNVAGL